MSEPVVVKCPSCSQKYRVTLSAVGHKARCKRCQTDFVISSEKPADEDTILGWITQDDPSSGSVMGSTGIFHESPPTSRKPTQAGTGGPPPPAAVVPGVQTVHLNTIGEDGAHFEFPATALAAEELRNSFPRKCAGCNTRTGLRVHLLYWPERMLPQDKPRWKEHFDAVVGDLARFTDAGGPGLLRQLPRARHMGRPFDLPFPVFACPYCSVSKEVETHVVGRAPQEVCHVRIASLAVAVSFLRNNGGRGTHAYQRLIEQRDYRHNPWRELDPQIRHGLSQWFELQAGEQFLRFFRDTDFSPAQADIAGAVLTDRRLAFKLHNEIEDYPLRRDGRIEVLRKAKLALAHVYLEGFPPAVLKLDPLDVDDLIANLRKLECRWVLVT